VPASQRSETRRCISAPARSPLASIGGSAPMGAKYDRRLASEEERTAPKRTECTWESVSCGSWLQEIAFYWGPVSALAGPRDRQGKNGSNAATPGSVGVCQAPCGKSLQSWRLLN